MNRRSFLGFSLLAATGIASGGAADVPADSTPVALPLWPGLPPGGEGVRLVPHTLERSSDPAQYRDRAVWGVYSPTLTVFRPAVPDGSALLILPGGGYAVEAYDLEGTAIAQLFNAHGVTAFVLTYRLPSEGWKDGRDVPLQDAQRAMRLIRSLGPRDLGLDPARVGVVGFSAGGHLGASLSTRFSEAVYAPVDAADALDARPSFAALLYPVVTMLPPFAHEASCEELLGPNASRALREAYSVERHVTPETPPTFLCAAADDPDVPIDNSLALLAGLRAQQVPCELHVFEKGGHGFALHDAAGKPVAAWPDLLLRWGADRNYFRAGGS